MNPLYMAAMQEINKLMPSTFPGVWQKCDHDLFLRFTGDSTDQGLWGAVLLDPNTLMMIMLQHVFFI